MSTLLADGTDGTGAAQATDRQGPKQPHTTHDDAREESMDEGNWITMGKNGKVVHGIREKPHPEAEVVQGTKNKINPMPRAPTQNKTNAGKITEYSNPDSTDENVATRLRRTVRATFTPNQGPYGRHSFAAHLLDINILNHLETCGATAQRNTFTLTFDSLQAAQRFREAGDFVTSEGVTCRVDPGRDGIRFTDSGKIRATVKCHWIPYHVDMANALKTLEMTSGIKITGARYDTVRNDPNMKDVRTGIRTVWLEVERLSDIPHKIDWQQGLQSGTALVTVFGRAVPCFRCWRDGHNRADCTAPKCDKCRQIGHFSFECSGISYAAKAQARQNRGTDQETENMELNTEDIDETDDVVVLKINQGHIAATEESTCSTREPSVTSVHTDAAASGGGATTSGEKDGQAASGFSSGSGHQSEADAPNSLTPYRAKSKTELSTAHVAGEVAERRNEAMNDQPGVGTSEGPNNQADQTVLSHPSCFSQEDDSTVWEGSVIESDEESEPPDTDANQAFDSPTHFSSPIAKPHDKLPKRKRGLKTKNLSNVSDNSSTETVKETKKPKQGRERHGSEDMSDEAAEHN